MSKHQGLAQHLFERLKKQLLELWHFRKLALLPQRIPNGSSSRDSHFLLCIALTGKALLFLQLPTIRASLNIGCHVYEGAKRRFTGAGEPGQALGIAQTQTLNQF